MENGDAFYTPAELAKLADCRVQQVYNYIHRNRLRYVYDGRYKIPRSVGDAWAKRLKERRGSS